DLPGSGRDGPCRGPESILQSAEISSSSRAESESAGPNVERVLNAPTGTVGGAQFHCTLRLRLPQHLKPFESVAKHAYETVLPGASCECNSRSALLGRVQVS